jgi:RNA polymerase sigma factor (TIGR02999 family)
MTDRDEGQHDVTRLLHRMRAGEEGAADALFAAVHAELARLAERQMRAQRPGHTLQPTALVHEAWLRLAGDGVGEFEGRGHFLAVAARAMRSVLVDGARRRQADKRGPDARRVTLCDELIGAPAPAELVLELEDALGKLAELDAELARVAEMRIFAGLSCAEVAEANGAPLRSTERAWATARAWLQRALGPADPGDGDAGARGGP